MLSFIPVLLCVVMTLVLVSLLTPLWIDYLNEDRSTNTRSSVMSTPERKAGGGVVFVPVLLFLTFLMSERIGFVSCLLILVATLCGFHNERKKITNRVRLLFQSMLGAAIYALGFTFAPIVNEFGFSIPEGLNFLATIFFTVSVINAFNLIRGVNGLALGVYLISSVTFLVVFYLQKQIDFFYLSIALIIGLIAFVPMKMKSSPVFFGYTGALMMGTYIVICLLNIVKNPEPNYNSLVISAIIYPCMDMMRLIIGRFLLARSPFKGDFNHIHHIILRLGFTRATALIFLYSLHTLLILTTILISANQPFVIQFAVLLLLNLCFYGVIQFLRFFRLRGKVRKLKREFSVKLQENVLLQKYVL